MLKPKTWARVDEIFDAALDVRPEERSRWLAEACGDDAELRREVERLLSLSEDEENSSLDDTGVLSGPLWHEVLEQLGAPEEEGLAAGDAVGDYEVVGFLGKGGMGRVYRALDRELGREVAIKALSPSFAPDASGRRRFEREAKLLASLNHPNIAGIYDFLVIDGHHYLVLELVEGETLQEWIARGPMNLEDVFKVAVQLVDAIEAAHEKGIVHRDLKPGNVKITEDGRVKVLDFGLAKSRLAVVEADESGSVTTQTGMVLGTPSYMSPEQARGDAVDEGTDVWAFGCLVYEMLTGERAFGGKSPSDVVAAVLRDDVDWERLPEEAPPEIRRLLRRCLSKPRRDRLQHIGDARLELEELVSGPYEIAAETRFRTGSGATLWLAIAAVVLVGVVLVLTRDRNPIPTLTNPVQITSTVDRDDQPAWSPDGRSIAYASLRGDDWDVWVRQVGGGDALNRTEEPAGTDFAPSWSPDGLQIAFRSEREGGGIFVVPPLSGAPRKIVDDPNAATFFAPPQWSADGTSLLYTISNRGDHHVEILSLATGDVRGFSIPPRWNCLCEVAWSPSGRFLAYVDAQEPFSQITELWLYRFEDGEKIRLADDRTRDWSPTWSVDDRNLYFLSNRGGSMDLWRFALGEDGYPEGDPEPVTVGVGMQRVSFSRDGKKLAYSKGRRVGNLFRVPILEQRPASWADAEQLTFDQAFVEFIDVTPAGDRVVLSSDRAGNPDLWSLSMASGELTRLTDDPTPDWLPAFSPDGTRIAFYAYRSGNRDLWTLPSRGGQARQVTTDEGSDASPGWTADGERLMFYSNRSGNVDLWSVPASGGEASLLAGGPGAERFARASPDGKWIAYTIFQGGKSKLVRVPAEGGAEETIAAAAATYFAWSRDSKSLWLTPRRGGGNDLWRVPLEGGEPRAMTDFRGRRGRLGRTALATDGKFVYFTWIENLGDIWVMDVEADR